MKKYIAVLMSIFCIFNLNVAVPFAASETTDADLADEDYIKWIHYTEDVLGNEEYLRDDIQKIDILDDVSAAPDNAWDISEKENGSILAWVDGDNTLFIAQDGGVKVNTAYYLFADYDNLTEINLENLDTSGATDMEGMFAVCPSLTEVDVSGFTTENVTDMSCMFMECSSLTELNLSNFDTRNVRQMEGMFAYCDALTELDLSNFNVLNTYYAAYMFYGCSSLTSYTGTLKFSDMADLEDAFTDSGLEDCLLSQLSADFMMDFSGEDTPTVFGNKMLSRSDIQKIEFLDDISVAADDAWDISEAQNGSVLAWVEEDTSLYIAQDGGVKAKTGAKLFSGYSNLLEIDIEHLDTGNATRMFGMFEDCSSLTELDLSGLDTSNATSMNMMFEGCSSLTKLNLSGFDTGNVTTMNGMFSDCSSLTELDLSGFDVSNITNAD